MPHRLMVKPNNMLLYGDVGDMWGDGSGFTARDVKEALAEVESGDITVSINSGGGIAWEGVAIYNALRAYSDEGFGDIVVEVDGIAASAASVIAMAGDLIAMKTGSTLMIHDPSAVTMGTASEHRKSAAVLDTLGEQIAAIYATRTGTDQAQLRELMLQETWMTAEEAAILNFVDDVEADEAVAAAAFDYKSVYASVPAFLEGRQRELPKSEAVATATETSRQDKNTMPKKEIVADTSATPIVEATAAAAAPAEKPAKKDITRDVLAKCDAVKLSTSKALEIVDHANNDMVRAMDLIVDAHAERDPSPASLPTASATVVADGRDRFREGAVAGLMARCGIGGERNEFTGMSLRELARCALDRADIKTSFSDPMAMIGTAFNPTMAGGHHSASDFSTVLADVAHKNMLIGHEEAEESFEGFTARGTLTDFKVHNRVDTNLFPSLSEVIEGAEYTYGTMTDRGSTIQLATYGRMFAITRQAVINDDLNAFSSVPRKMGRAARRTIGNLVWALITDNGLMQDGNALFSAAHGNLAAAGAAPSLATVDAGRVAMALQQDPDGNATALNIRPSYALVPIELEGSFRALMEAEIDPASTAGGRGAPNYVRGLVSVISDARLSANSAAAWYLAANPSSVDTIEVAYLNGNSSPMMEQREGWSVDGVEFKIRLDAGVQVHDWRGLYKDPGE